MGRSELAVARNWRASGIVLGVLLLCARAPIAALAAPQADINISPDPIPQTKPSAPATPAVQIAPPTPAVSAGPSAGPEVATVEPSSARPGFDVDLKITGKNFVQGTKVSFANPGIRTISVNVPSSTELTAHIKVARDAKAGTESMFVINPDDQEAEVPFEVTGTASTPLSPGTAPAPGSTATQSYSAFHLGNPAEVFQTHGKVKGSLVVTSGTLQYQEGGKTLINISLSEIKEIKVSTIATATFHITLNSGKTFHFAPGSLRPSDARSVVDSLRQALPH